MGSGLSHDGRPMVLHRALADAKIRGDVLAGMPREHEIQDLPLTHRQTSEPLGGPGALRGRWAVLPALRQRMCDAGDEFLIAKRLLEKV